MINWLIDKSAEDEIREAQWQGRGFVYPAVRVQVGGQEPGSDGSCYSTQGEVAFTIFAFSESDSSQEADILAGLANDALFAKHVTGLGFKSGPILSDSLIHAARTGERVWQAIGLYRMQIYGGLP